MSTENKNCAPRLRFPGFTGDWKEKKIGDVVGSVKRGQSLQSKDYMPGDIPVVAGGKQYAGYHNVANHEGSSITISGSGASAGYVALHKTPIFATDCSVIDEGLGYDLSFIYYVLLSMQDKIYKLQTGGAQPHIYPKNIEDIIAAFPPSLDEQKRIASCLSDIDDLICALGENIEALKDHKKGLMQQLFPLNGDKIPCLRFPGFEGEWVEKKFSDLYARHIVKNDLSFGVDKIISVANMYYKTDAKVGDDDYMRSYNIFRFGDIAFEGNKSANYAFGRFVENTIGDGIVSHVFDVYSPISNDHCLEYWRYAINYEPFMRPILEKSTKKTTMMTNLVSKDFLKQTILVPSLYEQKKIAECLTALDDQIAAESAKLEALKDHKKGLMQQLFPQPAK